MDLYPGDNSNGKDGFVSRCYMSHELVDDISRAVTRARNDGVNESSIADTMGCIHLATLRTLGWSDDRIAHVLLDLSQIRRERSFSPE